MENLQKLYNECIQELNSIGININEIEEKTDIKVSKRNNKRYGCCKQEEPDKLSKYITKYHGKRKIEYYKFNKHHIEISPWVMKLNKDIIKNTIIHEIIHCFPGCNNHGTEFKRYALYVNEKLGYNITRIGNKKDDYLKSNLKYDEKIHYNYKIECKNCGQVFYRQRCNKNFDKRYKCGKCNGKFVISKINE